MPVEFDATSAEDWSMSEAPGAGDRRVFANVYDTYAVHLFDYCMVILRNPGAAANAVQDTLIAADTQIGKLRDYEQLLVWLYSIARRQCLAELARPSQAATPGELSAEYDFSEEYYDDADLFGAEPDSLAGEQDRETLRVVRTALDGLSDRDREVLNLAFRHGIDDAGLGATLGVSTSRVRALVSRAGARFEKSAAIVAMLGQGEVSCPVLDDITESWDPASPRLTPILLKRLTGHIGACSNCSQRRENTVFGPDLLGAVPLAIPPSTLRFRITNTAADARAESYRRRVARQIGDLDKDGFPASAGMQRGMTVAMAASSAALVVLIIGGALLYKLTFGTPVGFSGATGATARANGAAPASSSQNSSAHARRSRTPRHVLVPVPGLFGPTPAPAGAPPVPLPHSTSPKPKPTRASPSPSPSPSGHSPSPTPTPTPTTPTPTPTPPDTTTPTPTPTDTTPAPGP